MPIHCPIAIPNVSSIEFEKIDYRVMGHAFASQNELGRLCDECAYHADLKNRLIIDDFESVHTEIPIVVAHGNFSKKYFLDLIVGGVLYELKTDNHLANEHEAQLFNYMFLVGVQRAKLLNFRPAKIQGKLIATPFDSNTRRRFNLLTDSWQDLTPACIQLREILLSLLQDWGAFLELPLYQEALMHFLGGQANVELNAVLTHNGISLGTQKMLRHAPDIAFRLTAVTEGQQHVQSHLQRLLALTQLKAIQWINLNRTQIELTTITKIRK